MSIALVFQVHPQGFWLQYQIKLSFHFLMFLNSSVILVCSAKRDKAKNIQKRGAILKILLFFQHSKMLFFLTLTECDAFDLRPLGVRQVPVHLLDDFLFHL